MKIEDYEKMINNNSTPKWDGLFKFYSFRYINPNKMDPDHDLMPLIHCVEGAGIGPNNAPAFLKGFNIHRLNINNRRGYLTLLQKLNEQAKKLNEEIDRPLGVISKQEINTFINKEIINIAFRNYSSKFITNLRVLDFDEVLRVYEYDPETLKEVSKQGLYEQKQE